MMQPALTTLLADTAFEESSDLGPSFGTHLRDDLWQDLIFTLWPRGTNHLTSITKFEIAFVALDLRFLHELADAVPRACFSKLFYQLYKTFIHLLREVHDLLLDILSASLHLAIADILDILLRINNSDLILLKLCYFRRICLGFECLLRHCCTGMRWNYTHFVL